MDNFFFLAHFVIRNDAIINLYYFILLQKTSVRTGRYINIIIIIIIIIILSWCPAGHRLISCGERSSLALLGSRLAEQGPLSGRCSWQGNIACHHANAVISKRRNWTSQESKIVMECYLLSDPKIRGYRKHMLSLWLQKGMFWVPEQRLVDQANTIRRDSWMTELEIEELERKLTGSDSVIAKVLRLSLIM